MAYLKKKKKAGKTIYAKRYENIVELNILNLMKHTATKCTFDKWQTWQKGYLKNDNGEQ